MSTTKFKSPDIIMMLIAILLLGGVSFAWYHYEQLNTELTAKITSQEQELDRTQKKIKLLEDLKKKFPISRSREGTAYCIYSER